MHLENMGHKICLRNIGIDLAMSKWHQRRQFVDKQAEYRPCVRSLYQDALVSAEGHHSSVLRHNVRPSRTRARMDGQPPAVDANEMQHAAFWDNIAVGCAATRVDLLARAVFA